MRFAYLTTDEVNQSLAQEMALDYDVIVYPLAPKDGPPDGGYDAVLCDWDSLPSEGRNEFLATLHFGHLLGRVAVHSYNLADDEMNALFANGVVVHKSLQPEVIQLLSKAALSKKGHPEREVQDETVYPKARFTITAP